MNGGALVAQEDALEVYGGADSKDWAISGGLWGFAEGGLLAE